MRSFQLPDAKWDAMSLALRHELAEIEQLRAQFPAVKDRLQRTGIELRNIVSPNCLPTHEPSENSPSVPFHSSQALSFFLSHSEPGALERQLQILQDIHGNYATMQLTPVLLRQWHELYLGIDEQHRGHWKQEENVLPWRLADGKWHGMAETIRPAEVGDFMESLHHLFDLAWSASGRPKLLLLAAYALDIFTIHPFLDGNGRVTRLAMLLLLLQAGHEVFHHYSLETAIGRRRHDYVKVLHASRQTLWFSSQHDFEPWARFVISLVLDAYRQVAIEADQLELLAAQFQQIQQSLSKMPDSFSRSNLLAADSTIPPEFIDLILARLTARGELQSHVAEGKLRWTKLSPAV